MSLFALLVHRGMRGPNPRQEAAAPLDDARDGAADEGAGDSDDGAEVRTEPDA